jgi:hypothetical protein
MLRTPRVNEISPVYVYYTYLKYGFFASTTVEQML